MMFTIVHRADTNSANVAFVESAVELHDGFGEMLTGVEILRLVTHDGAHLYRVSSQLSAGDVDEILEIATFMATGEITEALNRITMVNDRQRSGGYTCRELPPLR